MDAFVFYLLTDLCISFDFVWNHSACGYFLIKKQSEQDADGEAADTRHHRLRLVSRSARRSSARTSCSDSFFTVPWKSIRPSVNLYCSDSASQTLKYENSLRDRNLPSDRLTFAILYILFSSSLNVRRMPADVCQQRQRSTIQPCCNN